MGDTTLDEYYLDQQLTFGDVFAIVKGKMANKLPMTTAKEEMMEDFINDWAELFGYESL